MLYKSIGISKQSFHQKLNRQMKRRSEEQQLIVLIHQIRSNHPTMGIRDIYYKLKPQTMGRDSFEDFCNLEGFRVKQSKNWRRTTDSSGVIRFENKLDKIELKRINQVWQSDITYFDIKGQFYYITFIIDSFTRRIIGHSTSKRLSTEQTTIPALEMAIRQRKAEMLPIEGLIFHSDGGGQYYAKDFLKITKKEGIINSMCEYPWDNGKAERINGIIKNNYLIHRKINTFLELKKEVDHSVELYNTDKPHIRLKRKTPIQFEKLYICNGQQSDGEKSTTELKTQYPEEVSALRAEDNNPQNQISLMN